MACNIVSITNRAVLFILAVDHPVGLEHNYTQYGLEIYAYQDGEANRVSPPICSDGTCADAANAATAPLFGRQTKDDEASQAELRRIIEATFAENIRQGTFIVAPGIEAYMRVPLRTKEISKITASGSKAISILSEYLTDTRPRFEDLAIRCIGIIGGDDATQALKTGALLSRYSAARVQAVLFLGSSPGSGVELALKAITQVSGDSACELRRTNS